MDVFLSSNSREGYSQDVVDLFSKPAGARQQFRYARQWISDAVLERLKDRKYPRSAKAILCYVDQATKNTLPTILPVRFARIREVREHGSTISIVFKLGDFCEFEDLAAFNRTMRAAERELPKYSRGKLSGKYWLFDDGDTFAGVGASNDQTNWEHLVETYYETPNSREDMPFYRFEGITEVGTSSIIRPADDAGELLYTLEGGKRYEASIYHFHPKNDFPEYTLSVASDDGNLEPLNGDTRVLNTRYDQKDYSFETKRIILGAASSLAFRRMEKETGKLIWEDFALRVKIKPAWAYVAGYVIVVAIGFAAPFVVRTYSDPENNVPVNIAAVIGGLLVGAATLLKDRIRL